MGWTKRQTRHYCNTFIWSSINGPRPGYGLVSDEARKRDAGRGVEGGMKAADRLASKKYQQRQGGGGKNTELDKCLVPGCNRKHSWKECWSRPDGWKPQGYPGDSPPVTRPEWVQNRMKNGAWNKKGGKRKAAPAVTNEDRKGKEESSDDGLIVGSGDLLQATGIGAITIKGKEGEVLNVKGGLHVPVLAALSCSQLARQGYACTFNMGECTVSKGGTVVMEAKLDKGLYIVPVCVPRVKRAHGVKAEKATCSTHWRDVEQVTADLLHVHMGHAGRQKLVECVKKGELKDVEIKEGGGQPSKCLDCTTGKVPSTSFPTSTTRASAPLELVHTHVCGAMQTPYREKGSKYFITFMDNYSRLGWVTLVESKDEVAKDFKHWIRYAEREAAAKMKILRSVKEALPRPEWVESMREELESHKVNGSFELVDPAGVPPGMKVLGCQWVWKYREA
ncbi:unnamed protein product [Closterium sp. NIES-53]